MTLTAIPTTITTLGNEAFRQCYYLLPAIMDFSNTDLVTMGQDVFNSCRNIEKFIFPDNPLITTIPIGFFSRCDKLEEVVLPSGVEIIDDYVFS